MSKNKCKINYVNKTDAQVEFRIYNGWYSNLESEAVGAHDTGSSNLDNPNYRIVMAWWDDNNFISQNVMFNAPHEYTITLDIVDGNYTLIIASDGYVVID